MAATRAARTRLSRCARTGIALGTLLCVAACSERRTAPVLDTEPSPVAAASTASAAAAGPTGFAAEQLAGEWSELARLLPDRMTAVAADLRRLDRGAGPHGLSAAELARARASEREIYALWSKARAAFAQQNMPEAVATAKDVSARLDTLAASLKR